MSAYDAWKTGLIGDDGSHPGSPNYDPPESVLDCPNETGTFIADHEALDEMVSTAAVEILCDYMTSMEDEFARQKLKRQMIELADKCREEIIRIEDSEREADWRNAP